MSDNTFHFLNIGDAFETYQIEHSSDLRQWNPLVFGGIKTNFRGQADFKADKASDTRHGFFQGKKLEGRQDLLPLGNR